MFSFTALWVSMVMAVGLSAAARTWSMEKVITCNAKRNVQRLQCDNGVISVNFANYGRMANVCVNKSAPVTNLECPQRENLDFLQKRCNGKSSCEFSMRCLQFDDPCFKNFRYLETMYSCVQYMAPPICNEVCQNSIVHLSCEDGKRIQIVASFFGRSDITTCSFARTLDSVLNTTCISSDAACKAGESCNGRSMCSLSATADEFNEPCDDTYKYLRLKHICV